MRRQNSRYHKREQNGWKKRTYRERKRKKEGKNTRPIKELSKE
jgi:hypothetical protein